MRFLLIIGMMAATGCATTQKWNSWAMVKGAEVTYFDENGKALLTTVTKGNKTFNEEGKEVVITPTEIITKQ